MNSQRVIKWDKPLLDALCQASGVNHNTVRSNVKDLAQLLHLELPKIHVQPNRIDINLSTPLAYCTLENLYLTKEHMERKQCKKKDCGHLTFVKKIVTFF
jgi:hypothetical protein